MPDHDSIIVTGGDTGTELFAVLGFKVFLCGNQNIGTGIEPQEVCAPLFCQMVGHHHKVFTGQPQPSPFHSSRHNLKGLASAHTMGKQAVPAIEHTGNSISLVGSKADFRRHTGKADMAAVILAGLDAVEDLIVFLAQDFTALRVFPNPGLEGFTHHFLLLLCQHGFLCVQDTFFRAVRILHGVIYPAVTQVQAVLDDGVGVLALGAVGHIGQRIVCAVPGFSADIPLAGGCGIVGGDGIAF